MVGCIGHTPQAWREPHSLLDYHFLFLYTQPAMMWVRDEGR